MKFKKIAAGAIAAALAVGTMAVSASAKIYPIPKEERDPALFTEGGWMILLYNEKDLPGDGNKPATDRGLDLRSINSFTYYMELLPYPGELGMPLEEYDATLDGFGGSVIYSANGGGIGSASESDWYDEEYEVTLYNKYNWPQSNWWGFPAEGDTPEGRPEDVGGEGTNQGNVDYVDQDLVVEYVNTFTYKLELDIARDHADDPDFLWPDDGALYQAGVQVWGDGGNGETFGLKVDLLILKDIDGNFIMAFDEYGNEITEDAANEKINWLETHEVDLTAGPDLPDDGSDDPADDGSDDGAGDSEGSNDSDDGDSTTTTTTTTASSSSSSGDNTMLFIIIGVAAAVVIIVVIVIVVVKKKKS